ncbi:hypothetical protein [Streptomyces sp. NPDC051921]
MPASGSASAQHRTDGPSTPVLIVDSHGPCRAHLRDAPALEGRAA